MRGVSARPKSSWSFAAATAEPSSRYSRAQVRPLGSGSRSGARRSRRPRVPGSSHRSGSSRDGRVVRPRQAATTAACRSASRPATDSRRRSRSADSPRPRRSTASASRRAASSGSGGIGRSPSRSRSYASCATARTEPEASSKRCTTSVLTPSSHSRSTRLATRTIGSDAAPATPPVTSSASSSSPPRTPLSRPSIAPVPELRTSLDEPGSRRRATRSGKPASSARRSRSSPVLSSRGRFPTVARGICRAAGSLRSPAGTRALGCASGPGPDEAPRKDSLSSSAALALTPRGASRNRSAADRTSESVVSASPVTAGRHPSPSTAQTAAARAPPPADSSTRARRGWRGRRCMASPSCVSRTPDSAPSRSSSLMPAASPSAGGASNQSKSSGFPPQASTSRSGPARSTRSISGSRRGRRRSRSSQSRTTLPGPVRPARPARCSAESAGIRSNSSRSRAREWS